MANHDGGRCARSSTRGSWGVVGKHGDEIEGCLSVPGENQSIERSPEVVVDYDLEDGSRIHAERIGGADGT